jgi:hypothetical protein
LEISADTVLLDSNFEAREITSSNLPLKETASISMDVFLYSLSPLIVTVTDSEPEVEESGMLSMVDVSAASELTTEFDETVLESVEVAMEHSLPFSK